MSKTSTTTTSSRLIPTANNISPDSFKPFGAIIQNPITHGEDGSRLKKVLANQGSATKWLDITHLDDHYHLAPSRQSAKAVMNLFVCQSRQLDTREGKQVFPVRILERHPYTPQTFIPLGIDPRDPSTRYLVIVAPTLPADLTNSSEPLIQRVRQWLPFWSTSTSGRSPSIPDDRQPKGPGAPDLDNLQAFIVRGDQAVTYGPGTWHAPMVVLGAKAIDFVVVQYANGVGLEDCQEMGITAADGGKGLAVAIDGSDADESSAAAPGIMRAKL